MVEIVEMVEMRHGEEGPLLEQEDLVLNVICKFSHLKKNNVSI